MQRPREFNLDVSKLLLICSALEYERDQETLKRGIGRISQIRQGKPLSPAKNDGSPSSAVRAAGSAVGDRLRQVTGSRYDEVRANVRDADRFIIDTARDELGLRYVSLSELSTGTSSVCGAYFREDEPFIILAFKGTDPDEYAGESARG